METFGITILTVFAYIAVYSLVDRICKCFEYCARCKGTTEMLKKENKE